MNKLKEIETIVTTLSKTDLTISREWFSEFDAKIWDEQFEKDVTSGKPDSLINNQQAELSTNYKKNEKI